MAFEADLKLGRRRRARTLSVVLFGGAGLAWALASGAFLTPGLLAVLLVVAGMAIAATLRRPSRGRGRARRVRADGAGLHVDGVLAVPRRDVQGALVADTDDGAVVHVETGHIWRSCSVFTRSRDQADALVRALGLGHPDDLVRLKALPPWARHIRWLTVLLTTSPWFLFNVVRFVPPWGVLVLAGLYALVALPLVMPQYVEVAADGVLVRWLGSARFLPFRAIAEVEPTSVGVVLHTEDGRTHDIRLTQTDGARDVERDALLARIEAGALRHREVLRRHEESLLARGGRSVSEWIAAVRSLGGEDARGYRAAAIPRERLWEILEDPTSDTSARAGAAIALGGSTADAETHARLAEVAARTAAPSLRVAIEALGSPAADDDARVREAIERATALEELVEGRHAS